MTSRKTPHGPQKSMTTASSEMRKATGISPLAGGLSGFAVIVCLISPELPRAEFSESSAITKNASPASRPNLAALLSKSLPSMELVGAFMSPIVALRQLAAMPIITKFLPTGYFSLSFDFRMSNLTQCLKFVDTDDAAASVEASGRNIDRPLRELPHRDQRT